MIYCFDCGQQHEPPYCPHCVRQFSTDRRHLLQRQWDETQKQLAEQKQAKP